MQDRIMSCWDTLKVYLNDWYFRSAVFADLPFFEDAYVSRLGLLRHMRNRGFTNKNTIITYLSYLRTKRYIVSTRHFIKVIREIETDLNLNDVKNTISPYDVLRERFGHGVPDDPYGWEPAPEGESLSASSSQASSTCSTSKPEEFIEESEMIL